MRELYELHGRGWSVRRIARGLAISRNTVRKYLRSQGLPKEKPRRSRESKLDPYVEYIDGRQITWRLSTSFDPPRITGVMWSISKLRDIRRWPQYTHT